MFVLYQQNSTIHKCDFMMFMLKMRSAIYAVRDVLTYLHET